MSDPKPTLAAKLAEITLEVNSVEKDGHNDFQNYDYTSAEELLRVVRGPLASRNIAFFPKVTSVEERGITTPKGKPSTVTTAHLTFTLVDAESGEREECTWAGTGDDPSDKGLYKAYTGAIKTFLRQQFLLPMGDDPEGDTEADKRTAEGAKLADQVAALPGTVEYANADQLEKLDKARAFVGAKRFDAHLVSQGVDNPGELTKEQSEEVLGWARKQKGASGAKAA